MRYRFLIVIGALAVVVSPTVGSAAPIGWARSEQAGSCSKVSARTERFGRRPHRCRIFLLSYLRNCVGMGVRSRARPTSPGTTPAGDSGAGFRWRPSRR